MIDQNSQFFAILTAVGEAKQANATALGQPWTFSQMGVGDANGTDPIPARTQTHLINEWRRAAVNQVKTDPANPNIIITEQVIPADVGGKWIREIALYDADGDMVAVANCAPSFKPLLVQGTGKTQIIRMNFIVANTSNIVLKIDPSIVLATRDYVDVSIVEALAKLDFKHSALVATTANIVLSGIQTIDGVLLPAEARVLVKNQTVAKDNGLYVVPAAGAWRRALDADSSLEVTPGLFISIEKGTVNADSVWQLVTDGPIDLGTTDLLFEMAVGRSGISSGSYANVTVDKYGRVVAGTNPTTLAGYGITDALRTKGSASGLDLNTLVTDGRYSGSAITNAPDAGFWYVDVQQHGSDGKYCRQTLWRITGANTEQLQRHQNNGVWTPFIKAKTERGIFSFSASQALTVNHMGLVNVDAAGGDRDITLPASDAALGVVDVVLRRVDNSANKLNIKAAGTDKVKFHTHLNATGYGFFYLMGAGDWWHLRSDGSGGWYVLGRLDSTPLGRPTFETTTAFPPGGNGPLGGVLYNRSEWPWLWDHAQASGMLTTEALKVGLEGCWTSGDGSLTFRAPDVRGEFLRALDEKRGVEKDVIYGNLTVGSPTVTAVSFVGSTFGPGATISGTGIPVGATVSAVNVAAGTITMSANATAAGSTSITVIGRQPGSSQAGTPNNIDTGSSNAVLSGKVSGINDPGVARVGFAMDEGDITKYHASAGQFAIGATNGGPFSAGTEASWGQVRPRNIAYPGRIKLI